MMKGRTGVLLFLAILSIVSGPLMSKASLVGRAGITLFYRDYNFLKAWWKGALLVFLVLMLLFILHGFIQTTLSARKTKAFQLVVCLVALTGLYLTYNDFRHTISHHLLGERFHLGAYLFWIGWIVIALFFLVKPARAIIVIPDNTYLRDPLNELSGK